MHDQPHVVGAEPAQDRVGDCCERVRIASRGTQLSHRRVNIDRISDRRWIDGEPVCSGVRANRLSFELRREFGDLIAHNCVLFAAHCRANEVNAGEYVPCVRGVLHERCKCDDYDESDDGTGDDHEHASAAHSAAQPGLRHRAAGYRRDHNGSVRDDLVQRLIDLGASPNDIERAADEGWLPLLALDSVLVPGVATYDAAALATAAGISADFARRLWRALGFPDVPDGLPVFTERDLAAAQLAVAQAGDDLRDEDSWLQQVRVISGSLARVAAVEADGFAESVRSQRAKGANDETIAWAILTETRLSNLAVLIDYVHRLQLRAAVWRRLARDADPDLPIAVGFADLSGYTELSAELDAAGLSRLVGRWEAIAYDTVAVNGARVVKTIGDEVMFVGLADETLLTGLALRDATRDAELPALRVGIAAGPVIPREGDYFGPVVNLASRLTEVAARGEVLIPADLRADLAPATRERLRFAARGARFLRSIGSVEVVAADRAG